MVGRWAVLRSLSSDDVVVVTIEQGPNVLIHDYLDSWMLRDPGRVLITDGKPELTRAEFSATAGPGSGDQSRSCNTWSWLLRSCQRRHRWRPRLRPG